MATLQSTEDIRSISPRENDRKDLLWPFVRENDQLVSG